MQSLIENNEFRAFTVPNGVRVKVDVVFASLPSAEDIAELSAMLVKTFQDGKASELKEALRVVEALKAEIAASELLTKIDADAVQAEVISEMADVRVEEVIP